jgi:signal transduction histidine kinase
MYLGTIVVVTAVRPAVALALAPTLILILLATGWLARYAAAAGTAAFAAVMWTLLGFHLFALDLGAQTASGGVATYIAGLLFIGFGRMARIAWEQGRDARLARQRADALTDQDEFRTRFLRMAAHEIGTPLTPIKVQLAVMRKNAGPAEQEGYGRLQRNVERLERLSHDLLDAGHMQSGQLDLEIMDVDLASIAWDVAMDNQDQAAQEGVKLRVEADGAVPTRGDPHRLAQVAWNLVRNALRFTPSGGEVIVRAGSDDSGAWLEVEDTGLGMTPTQLGGLFQPFSQFHQLEVAGGNGLGLFISKAIVEGHNGRLAATSSGPGKGTTFRAELPTTP